VVEKEREKDLGKVVTGGGEGTGKTNHGGHGEGKPQRGIAATKQVWRHKKSSRAEKNLRASSTENTEDTEVEKRGRTRWSAPTRRGIGLHGGRWVKGAKAAGKPAAG